MARFSTGWVVAAAALALGACGSTAGSDDPGGSGGTPGVSAPSTSAASATPGDATQGTYTDYSEKAFAGVSGERALFFHASWCPQCRALDADLRSQGVPDGLSLFKVDYDEATDLRRTYDVRLQTTVVWVGPDGRAVKSVVLYDDPSVAALDEARP